MQKPRIFMPLIEPMKNKPFKKSILDALEPKTIQASNEYVNMQYDQLAIILSRISVNCEDISPSFYVSLSIHDEILHNFPLDTRASHNSMSKDVMDKFGLDITKPYQLAST